MMDLQVAVYRWILRVYPAKFRRAYGEAMTQLFTDLLADQRRSGHPLGVFQLWANTVGDTLSSASREQKEEAMHNSAALTRALLVVVPVAVFMAFALAGSLVALPVLIVGIVILAARRRSLPDALFGPRRGRWWVWSLVGLATIGSGFIVTVLPIPFPGDVQWGLFGLFFVAGAIITGASIIQALILSGRQPSSPSVR